MVKAVIFDMDGTLLDTEVIGTHCWREAGKRLGLSWEILSEVLTYSRGRQLQDSQAYFERKVPDVSYDDFSAVRSEVFWNEVARRGGIPKKVGMDELFSYLKLHGYKMALATSTVREKTERNLACTGLSDAFDAIVTGDMIENGKPCPDIFLRAAEMLGVEPGECMGVEDSLAGVEAIHRAGMFCVMVPDTVEPTPEIEALIDVKCETLHDIIPILQQKGHGGVN